MQDVRTKAESKAAHSKADQLEMLKKIWSKVRPEEKEDQIITYIMRMVHNALNASATSLLLGDEKKQELYFKFASGPAAQKLERLHIGRQSGIAGWIVKKAKPIIVNNPEKNANFYRRIDHATGFKTKTIIGVPLIFDGKVKGVIEALNKKDGTNFTKDDLHTMIDMANITALTLESTRMNVTLLHSYNGTVKALVALADAKETSGGGHSRRE